MATHAPTTGARTCATIIPFPDLPIARARRELRRCHTLRMLDRWIARVAPTYPGLTYDDRLTLGVMAVQHRLLLTMEGC